MFIILSSGLDPMGKCSGRKLKINLLSFIFQAFMQLYFGVVFGQQKSCMFLAFSQEYRMDIEWQ